MNLIEMSDNEMGVDGSWFSGSQATMARTLASNLHVSDAWQIDANEVCRLQFYHFLPTGVSN